MSRFVYNPAQLAIKLSNAKHKMVVAGRGIGKTTALADEILSLVRLFPRGKMALIGLTYYHIKTKSMPVMVKHWEKKGFRKDVHYFVGRKPPKNWRWPEAYMPPMDHTHSVVFFNGFTIEFISMDRPEIARSGSYDYQAGDEAAKIAKDALDSDISPARRGNREYFGHIRRHLGTMYFTTHALDLSGEWVYDYRKYSEQDDDYFYLEASARDNIKNLGADYFRDQARVMSKAVYDLEIENIRPLIKSDSFYPKFDYSQHTYVPLYNYGVIDVLDTEIDDCRKDLDFNDKEPLDVSLDFGARLNCIVVGQRAMDNTYKLIKNFFVSAPLVLSDVVAQLVRYYRFSKSKTIYLYGGSDGARRSDYASSLTYYEKIQQQLIADGWKVVPRYQNREIPHKDKYLFFQELFSGGNPNLPKVLMNRENFKEGIVSIKNSPLLKNDIKKDKSAEKKNVEQWQATHLSDAMDNLLYHKFSHAGGAIQAFAPTRMS